MKENYLITIEGLINMGDDADSVCLTTVGSFYRKNDKHYIVYKETEATGFDGCTTSLKVWENGVSMTRYGGPATSNLKIGRAHV